MGSNAPVVRFSRAFLERNGAYGGLFNLDNQDDRGPISGLPQTMQHSTAIQSPHQHIHQEQIRFLRRNLLEGFFAIGCLGHSKA